MENALKEDTNMTEWLPCVVSDGTLRVNTSVTEGDKIYRIFNKKFDVKAIMTIKSLGWSTISVHLMDIDVDISNIKVDESLRVSQTSSENDPGVLVVKRDLEYNKELTPGCLYRVIDSELNFRYLMYIRRFNDTYIDADIIKFAIFGIYSNVKTEHRQLSIIDLKDMMFTQISLGKGCNFKFE